MALPEIVKDIDARVKIPGDTMTGNLIAPTFIGTLDGNASSADKLNTNAGSLKLPIYFNDGKPVVAADDYVFYDEVSGTISSGDSNLFVLKSGDIMTGNLRIENDSYPGILLKLPTANRTGLVEVDPSGNLWVASRNDNSGQYSSLIIGTESTNLKDILSLRVNNDSGNNLYSVYHAGNKPTPADIGAPTIAEFNSLKTSVSNGKSAVASAITDKGISTSATATFDTMANNIRAISTGIDTSDATATAAQILSGSTAYVKGSKITGTMVNQGAKTSSLSCGGSYTIPAGYHNGSGKITANSLASQTSATATAAKILSGYTAWVNGSKITGTASGAPTDAYISDCPSFIYNTYVSLSGSTLTFGGVANRANSQFEISIELS